MERSFDRFSDFGYPDLDIGIIFISKRLVIYGFCHHLRHGLATVWLFEDFVYPWVDQIPAFP